MFWADSLQLLGFRIHVSSTSPPTTSVKIVVGGMLLHLLGQLIQPPMIPEFTRLVSKWKTEYDKLHSISVSIEDSLFRK